MKRAMAVVLASALGFPPAVTADEGYRAEIEKWRTQREERLKADGGWLTVAGLFWLKEGSNRFGTAAANAIVLPRGSAPAVAGDFELREGKVAVRVEPGAAVTKGGEPVTAMELRPDTAGGPDVLTLGRLTLHVIERDGRHAIRLKDMDSDARRGFKGLRWFPVREDYRVTARFVPHPSPRKIAVPNILGYVEEISSPGYAVFTVGGKEVRLEPVLEGAEAKELFFIFRDETAGKQSYPAGRFLYSPLPREGSVVLDFNKAYSPPCAFTAYATCPLPPRQNRLAVRIEAGEMYPGHH